MGLLGSEHVHGADDLEHVQAMNIAQGMTPPSAAQATKSHHFLGARHDVHARRTMWVLLLCASMMGVEIVAGLLFGSMALLADGLHMATHAGVMLVAAAAYHIARKRQDDPSFSLGTGKIGDLAAFASALALASTAVFMAIESIKRLVYPVPIALDEAIPVACVALAVNLISIWLLHDDHGHGNGHGLGHGHAPTHDHHHQHDDDHDDHVHHHHGHGDLNLRAAYAHVVSDAGLGVLAIVGLIAARQLGWVWLDPLLGLLAAAVILRWAVALLVAASSVLLDRVPDQSLASAVRKRLERDGARVTDFHIWQLGPGHNAVMATLAGGRFPADHYRRQLEAFPTLSHVTIEITLEETSS